MYHIHLMSKQYSYMNKIQRSIINKSINNYIENTVDQLSTILYTKDKAKLNAIKKWREWKDEKKRKGEKKKEKFIKRKLKTIYTCFYIWKVYCSTEKIKYHRSYLYYCKVKNEILGRKLLERWRNRTEQIKRNQLETTILFNKYRFIKRLRNNNTRRKKNKFIFFQSKSFFLSSIIEKLQKNVKKVKKSRFEDGKLKEKVKFPTK